MRFQLPFIAITGLLSATGDAAYYSPGTKPQPVTNPLPVTGGQAPVPQPGSGAIDPRLAYYHNSQCEQMQGPGKTALYDAYGNAKGCSPAVDSQTGVQLC